MSDLAKQAWQPGLRIISEPQYLEVTTELARTLLRQYTPEQVALIAAQHLVYVDALNQVEQASEPRLGFPRAQKADLDDNWAVLKESLTATLTAGLTEDMQQIAKLVANGRMKASSKSANDVRHEVNRRRNKDAMVEWEGWPVRDKKGKKLAYKFAEANCSKYGVTATVMCRWITVYEKGKSST